MQNVRKNSQKGPKGNLETLKQLFFWDTENSGHISKVNGRFAAFKSSFGVEKISLNLDHFYKETAVSYLYNLVKIIERDSFLSFLFGTFCVINRWYWFLLSKMSKFLSSLTYFEFRMTIVTLFRELLLTPMKQKHVNYLQTMVFYSV